MEHDPPLPRNVSRSTLSTADMTAILRRTRDRATAMSEVEEEEEEEEEEEGTGGLWGQAGGEGAGENGPAAAPAILNLAARSPLLPVPTGSPPRKRSKGRPRGSGGQHNRDILSWATKSPSNVEKRAARRRRREEDEAAAAAAAEASRPAQRQRRNPRPSRSGSGGAQPAALPPAPTAPTPAAPAPAAPAPRNLSLSPHDFFVAHGMAPGRALDGQGRNAHSRYGRVVDMGARRELATRGAIMAVAADAAANFHPDGEQVYQQHMNGLWDANEETARDQRNVEANEKIVVNLIDSYCTGESGFEPRPTALPRLSLPSAALTFSSPHHTTSHTYTHHPSFRHPPFPPLPSPPLPSPPTDQLSTTMKRKRQTGSWASSPPASPSWACRGPSKAWGEGRRGSGRGGMRASPPACGASGGPLPRRWRPPLAVSRARRRRRPPPPLTHARQLSAPNRSTKCFATTRRRSITPSRSSRSQAACRTLPTAPASSRSATAARSRSVPRSASTACSTSTTTTKRRAGRWARRSSTTSSGPLVSWRFERGVDL